MTYEDARFRVADNFTLSAVPISRSGQVAARTGRFTGQRAAATEPVANFFPWRLFVSKGP